MSAPPPPLPSGGPPPPLPNNVPPPAILPPPPMPPPMLAPPPPMTMAMPMQMPHRGGGGMGGRSPFTNTILITNLPPFFGGYQQVRDWLYPCGTAKTCLFYPRLPKRKKNHDNNNNNHNNTNSIDVEMVTSEESNNNNNNKKKTVLVNMLNPDQALKVVASFQHFGGQLDERYKDIRCYMVPSSPDIPLPPPLIDETSKTVLGDKLWNNFVGLETAHLEKEQYATTSSKEAGEGESNKNSNNESGKTEPKLLDADKVAAAAGGAYDADEDPLNAPQVLEAVKEFRRTLDLTHGSQKTQRMDLVAKKLKELRPKIRAQVRAERHQPQQQQRQHQAAPPPPLPSGGPPLPLGLPPPPSASADSGKRGRSNLPAWMTQQQQQQQTSNNDEPSAKKQKTSNESYPSHFPSTLPQASHSLLRQFLANQVKESMGEEEATLIDFLYTHILQGKATSELLQELQAVLEEEADGFLKAVWAKVQEIQQQ